MKIIKFILKLFSNNKPVFIIQDKNKMLIYGCFKTRKKAETYTGNSGNIQIVEIIPE